MKILEINKFHFAKGGADRHFLDVIKILKMAGHEVAVFSMDHKQNEFSPWKKYFVSYVGFSREDSFWDKTRGLMRIFYSFEAKRKIKKLLDDFQPDLVHIHNIYHQISPSILSEIKKRGIPVVMTAHDYKLVSPNYNLMKPEKITADWNWARYQEFIINKEFKNSFWQSAFLALETFFHRTLNIYDKNIDLYIAPSEFLKKYLVQGGISEEKVVVIPHFSPITSGSENTQTGFSEKYVFHFGRLSKAKNIPELLEMFSHLPQVSLYLAGKQEEKLIFPEKAKIKYLGYLSRREVEHYLAQSLCVVSASRLPETFGLISLEAISHGKPFVGFDTGAFSEIIRDNQEGFLVKSREEFLEKVKTIVNDEGLRILFSRNGLERAKDFSGEAYLEHFFETMEKRFPQLTKSHKNDRL